MFVRKVTFLHVFSLHNVNELNCVEFTFITCPSHFPIYNLLLFLYSLESRFDDTELNELLDDLKTHINYQY